MKEKLNSLYLLELKKCKRYEYFLKSFEEDPFTKNYLYSDFSHFDYDKEVEKVSVGNTYIVSYDGKRPVGLLRLHSISSFGVLTLHYGIHPDFRRQGYGRLLLEEVSSYLFQKNAEVKAIELVINQENIGSMKCAKQAGFQEESEKEGLKVYQKRKTI